MPWVKAGFGSHQVIQRTVFASYAVVTQKVNIGITR